MKAIYISVVPSPPFIDDCSTAAMRTTDQFITAALHTPFLSIFLCQLMLMLDSRHLINVIKVITHKKKT